MNRATPSLQTARHRRNSRLTSSLALLLGLGLSVALLAGCGKTAPDASAPAASAPASAPPLASSSTVTEPAAPTLPASAAASAAPPAVAAAPPVAAEAPASQAGAALPPAVLAFQKQRDACDHFRGEEPYDKQRAAFLKAQLAKTCKGSDRALAALRKRFAHDPEAIAALKDYEDRIE